MQMKHLIFRLNLIYRTLGCEFYFCISMPLCYHPIFDNIYRAWLFLNDDKGFYNQAHFHCPLVTISLCHFCDNWRVTVWGHHSEYVCYDSLEACTYPGGHSPGLAGSVVYFILSEEFIEISVKDSSRKASFPLYHMWVWLLVFLL